MSGAGPTNATFEAVLGQRFALGLCLIAAMILATAFQVHGLFRDHGWQSAVVNTAGAQRASSQRIAMLSRDVVAARTPSERDALRAQLRTTLDRMRSGHERLTAGPYAPARASIALRHWYSTDGADLLRRTPEFLRNGEAVYVSPEQGQPYAQVLRERADDLLRDLDQAVSLYQAHVREQQVLDQRIHFGMVALTLVTVLAMGLFLFGPLTRRAAEDYGRLNAALDERSRQLSDVMRSARMGHWRYLRARPDWVWLSREFIELIDLPFEEGEVRLRDLTASLHSPQVRFEQARAIQTVMETHAPVHITLEGPPRDGAARWIQVELSPLSDADGGLIGITAICRDVTMERNATLALAAQHHVLERHRADLAEAQALGRVGSWRYLVASGSLEWSDQVFTIFGLDRSTFSPEPIAVRALYIGDGAKRVREMAFAVIADGQPATCDVQAWRGDGSVIDLQVRAKPETDPSGAVVSIFGTYQDVTEARSAARELEQLAFYDHLTGLANRALFKRELKKACERAHQDGRARQIILLDLDQFKDVNDSLGHAAGDELLAIVAKRLSAHTTQDHLIARLGGDEFAILISEPDAIDVMAYCNALVAALCEPVTLERGEVGVGASLGLVSIPHDASDPEEAMRCADLALYAAKEAGRRRAMRFHSSMSESMQARLSLAREIRHGLREKQFVPHFQPVFDLRSNRVAGFEALLRWPHPTRGEVPPSEFVPIAESSHLIAELGGYVLDSACAVAQGWVRAGLGVREIAINVSTAQVWHGDLEDAIDHALKTSGLDPGLLCIELTESVFAADALSRLQGILNRLKARGVTLALDDFGTGYSSLGYLNRLPFDKLKIDRSFVAGSDRSESKRRLLRGIVELGHGLGMKVVAEGVETAGELKTARDLGCDLVQGWYFAKAMPDGQAVAEAARIEALAGLTPFLSAPAPALRHQG